MDGVAKAFSKLTHLSISMLVPIGFCFFLGRWIDEKLGTGSTFIIIFLILGIASAFRNFYVIILKEYIDEAKKEKEKGFIVNASDDEIEDD